jgi:integrase
MNGVVNNVMPSSGMSVVYDLKTKAIVAEITDYSIWLARDERKNPKTIVQTSGHLVRLYAYLSARGLRLCDLNDSVLREFLDAEFESVKRNARSRSSEQAAARTVNQKVSAILNWLLWLQREGACASGTIGPSKCRVTAWPSRQPRRSGADAWRPGSGIGSHHFRPGGSASQFVPAVSRDTYRSLCRYIDEISLSTYIARRDSLFVDIASNAGFRRGSICSLRVDQFDESVIKSTDALTLPLKPIVQKFHYEHQFEVSTLLMLRVREFIEGPRADLLKQLGVSESAAKGKVFLSAKTGKPLTDRAMTHRISKAMRAVGCRKGQAIHVFRGLFANEAIDDEIEERLSLGLDTSTESVSAAVSTRLGQKRSASLFTYIAAEQSRYAKRRRAAASEPTRNANTKGTD